MVVDNYWIDQRRIARYTKLGLWRAIALHYGRRVGSEFYISVDGAWKRLLIKEKYPTLADFTLAADSMLVLTSPGHDCDPVWNFLVETDFP